MADNTFEDLLDKELESMDVFLTSKVSKSAITLEAYIETRLLKGVLIENIEQELLKDLENGGPLFGEFRNAIRATVHGNTRRISDIAQFSESGVKTEYRWVAVLINTCRDCIERHNQVKSWDEWEDLGLPRTGMTVCKDWCNCVLLPAHTTVLSEPVRRSR